MKFEDLLMQPREESPTIKDLKEEVEKLQQQLDGELQLQRVLKCALQQPFYSRQYVPSLLPSRVQMLLKELTMVEEEIIWLERKVDELKLNLYQEKKQTKQWERLQLNDLQPEFRQWHKRELIPKQLMIPADQAVLHNKHTTTHQRRTSVGSSIDMDSFRSSDEVDQNSRCSSSRSWASHFQLGVQFDNEKPFDGHIS